MCIIAGLSQSRSDEVRVYDFLLFSSKQMIILATNWYRSFRRRSLAGSFTSGVTPGLGFT
jgi:hypothetical protein